MVFELTIAGVLHTSVASTNSSVEACWIRAVDGIVAREGQVCELPR